MCGIVGFWSKKSFLELKNDLISAIDSVSHRGPDDTGIYLDEKEGIGLGHKRLSIIDLSSLGHQPMSTEDKSLYLIYNGEVYNFNIIKKQLMNLGEKFLSRTDTEVILKSFKKWGIKCLKKFNGMFSFALWDSANKRLFLVRDRLGIKPLYYYYDDHMFIFSSELKAILKFRIFKREIDINSLILYLHFQYIPSPHTIFKNTYKLPPGSYLVYEESGMPQIRYYWKIPTWDPQRLEYDEEEIIKRLDDLLNDSIRLRLISDVPLGALLSGGIDSSLVVSIMQKNSINPVKTFTIGFFEDEYNEANYAKKIAHYLGTDHSELYLTIDDALNVIPNLPIIYDEPFGDSSSIPTFLVCSLAKQKVTVALSGDGGDEQFAGYVRYWTSEIISKKINKFPLHLRIFFAKLLGRIPFSFLNLFYLKIFDYLPQYIKVKNFHDKWEKLINILINNDNISEIYRMTICIWDREQINNLLSRDLIPCMYDKLFEKTLNWPIQSRLMYIDKHTYLPDAMLTKIDRASMAVSLEVRVPLLDHRVIEFTSLIPDDLKYKNKTGKYILKKLLQRYIPKEFFDRPKMGFGVPIGEWFRGKLKDLLLDYLSDDRLRHEGIFNIRYINRIINEHLFKNVNHQYRLWTLLMWEMWREKWL